MRPSAGIGVVEVQKLGFFFALSRCVRDPPGIGVVDVQKLEVLFAVFACELVFGNCLVVCAAALRVARSRVRSPRNFQCKSSTRSTFPQLLQLKVANFKYKSSTRSTFPELQLQNRKSRRTKKQRLLKNVRQTHSQVYLHTHGFQCFRAIVL